MQCVFAYALMGVGMFFFASTVIAGTTVTDAYDQPSSLALAAAANHTFTFTTASSVSEGSTIVLTFDADFVTASLTEDDVDIADDGVDLTTAADCSGSEQASVAVAGSVVTMTICAGDGGAIASGSVVIVEMGANAASSGLGTNRITNPSAAATYYVNLSGTFGGSASFPLPIHSDDSGSVSAIVSPSSSGGSSGGTTTGGTTTHDPDTTTSTDPETEEDTSDTDATEGTDDVAPSETDSVDDVVTVNDAAPSGTSGGGGSTDGESTGNSNNTDSAGSSSSQSTTSGSATASTDEVDEADGGNGEIPSVTTEIRIVTDSGIVLLPQDGATYDALVGTDATIEVDVTTSATIEAVRIDVDGTTYVLAPTTDGRYVGVIRVPSVDSMIDVAVDTVEAPTAYRTYFVDARGPGLVYENVNNSRTPVNGAVVTVYEVVDGARVPWSGTNNPFVVGASGSFSLYVPNGMYVVTAGKSGYDDGSTGEIVIRDNILAPTIALTRSEEVVGDAPEIVIPPETPTTTVPDIASFAATVSAFIATPEVQTAIDIAKPATAVLAAASLVVLASSFHLLPFLQYMFTAPILFFARRKRNAFGVVYNAATKLPIDLAIVRLFSMPERRLVRSVVTDAKGKYLLAVAPGMYTIVAVKQGCAFPSQLLQGKKDDGTYLDVYTGQTIEVTDASATIAVNIPLDPAHDTLPQQSLHTAVVRRFLRVLQYVISLLGIALAAVVLVLAPGVFTAIMFVAQIVVYLLAHRLARPRRAKGWGIVYDAVTREPVGNAVVRLFEPTYNKLVETTISDRLGRYAFLVGPSEYYVTYAKPGYVEKVVKPIDCRKNIEPTALALDVPIEEHKGDV